MPNWCMNNLTVTGKPERLNAIADAISENKFFEHIVPIGEWEYENALSAWGTKWDANGATVDFPEEDTLSVVFDTAWSPPIGVLEALCDDPDIDSVYCSYFEPGMDFGGEWEDGDDRFCENLQDEFNAGNPLAQELNEQFDLENYYDDGEEPEELSTWLEEGMQEKNLQKGVDIQGS